MSNVAADDRPAVFRPGRKIFRGMAMIAASVGGGALLAWVCFTPINDDGSFDGNQILILMPSPIFVGGLLYFAGLGWRMIALSLTTVAISTDAVQVRRPWGTRRLRWAEVDDFALPASSFPNPPQTLRLFPRQGRVMNVPLGVESRNDLRRALLSAFPALATHGLDRPKHRRNRPVPSSWRVRWLHHRGNLPVVLAVTAVLAFFAYGMTLISREQIYSQLLRRTGVMTDATVVEVLVKDEDGEDESVRAVVRFTASDGRDYERRRRVLNSFKDEFAVGDMVAVQYLPGEPKRMRIVDWDGDATDWILLAFGVPMTLWLGRAWLKLNVQWIRPLHVRCRWRVPDLPDGTAPGLIHVDVGPAPLVTLRDFMPEQHAKGDLLLLDFRRPGTRREPNPEYNAGQLRDAGIEVENVDDKVAIVAEPHAARLFSRLGNTSDEYGHYAFVAVGTAAHVVAEIQGSDDDADFLDTLKECQVYHLARYVGPLDSLKLSSLFDRWTQVNAARLWDGAMPPHFDWPREIGRLLRVDTTTGLHEMLIERRGDSVRLWHHDGTAKRATLLAQPYGQWITVPSRRVPRRLRPANSLIVRGLAALIGLFTAKTNRGTTTACR